jgi:hypothetical protein
MKMEESYEESYYKNSPLIAMPLDVAACNVHATKTTFRRSFDLLERYGERDEAKISSRKRVLIAQ